MTKFIRSASDGSLINISRILRIFEERDPIILSFKRALAGKGLKTGIHCEISSHHKPLTVPLALLQQVELVVKTRMRREVAEAYMKFLSSKMEKGRLFNLIMFELTDCLKEKEPIINMYKVIEAAILTHQDISFDDDSDSDDFYDYEDFCQTDYEEYGAP